MMRTDRIQNLFSCPNVELVQMNWPNNLADKQ